MRDRALAAGAVRAHVLDVREEFARDYVLRALKADAMYEDRYPMGTALGRPAHRAEARRDRRDRAGGRHRPRLRGQGPRSGCASTLDRARALNPAITVLAPAREWGMTRPEEIEYARTRGIPVPATVDSPYSIDANLWGRSIECGDLEDPWTEPPEEIYTLTKAAEECPGEAAYVEITFERGVPTAINGVVMPLVELIASLGTIAARAHRRSGAASNRARSTRRPPPWCCTRRTRSCSGWSPRGMPSAFRAS